MDCIICRVEIESGVYGSTSKGLVHKECYEKEHSGKRGKRPNWIILNNAPIVDPPPVKEKKEVIIPFNNTVAITLPPKQATVSTNDGMCFRYRYSDINHPEKEVTELELVEIAKGYGYKQSVEFGKNVDAGFYLRQFKERNPALKVSIALSRYA